MRKEKGHTLLILSQHAKSYADIIIAENLPGLEIIACETEKDALSIAEEANIILGGPNLIKNILPAAKRLEWVQSTWAGVTPLTEKGCRKNYLLTGIKGVFGPVMAEYAICYILLHERNVLKCLELQLKKKWKMPTPGLLRGKTVGIMGVGSIGTAIAQAVKSFNIITWGYSRKSSPRPFFDQIFGPDLLLDFVSDIDYLIAVLPDTPSTNHLIDSSVLKAMKPEAILINVGRGNAVDEGALINALNNREIAGAVLDVFQHEPLPQDHPFWETPGLLITSHKAAISYPEDITPLFLDNYRRFKKGDPLKYQIDFEKGY